MVNCLLTRIHAHGLPGYGQVFSVHAGHQLQRSGSSPARFVLHLDLHGNRAGVRGFGAQMADVHRVAGREGKFSDGAVPDGLGTVGVGVGQRVVADFVLLIVVDTQQEGVRSRVSAGASGRSGGAWSGSPAVVELPAAIHVHPALPEHPFQHQFDLFALPACRNRDGAPVPGRTDVAVLAGQLVQCLAVEGWLSA